MTKDSTVYAPTTFELAETADCWTFFIKQQCQVAACSKFIVYILNSRQNTTRLRDPLEFRFVTNFDSLTTSRTMYQPLTPKAQRILSTFICSINSLCCVKKKAFKLLNVHVRMKSHTKKCFWFSKKQFLRSSKAVVSRWSRQWTEVHEEFLLVAKFVSAGLSLHLLWFGKHEHGCGLGWLQLISNSKKLIFF